MTIPSFSNEVTPYEQALANSISEVIDNICTVWNATKKTISSGAEIVVGLATEENYDITDQLLEKPLENIMIGKTLHNGVDIPSS